MPVNMTRSPLLQPRRDQQVVAHALAVERQRPDCLRDRLDSFALERIARGSPAEYQRRQEQTNLVHFARVQEGTRKMGAALEQDRANSGGAELVKRRAHAGCFVLA